MRQSVLSDLHETFRNLIILGFFLSSACSGKVEPFIAAGSGTSDAIPSISIPGSTFIFLKSVPIVSIIPVISNFSSVSIYPDITANTGLNFNVVNGSISGTPIVGHIAESYTLTATNSSGVTSTAIIVVSVLPSFFVSTSGSNSNPGTFALPWKTITYAASSASAVRSGDTVFIKAGIYAGENIVPSRDSMSFIGYKSVPGDSPSILANSIASITPATVVSSIFDQNEQPLIDGGNRNSGVGINIKNRAGISIRNISITNFAYGVLSGNTSQSFQENHILDNINVSNLGDVNSAYSGLGISLGSMGTLFSNGSKISNSVIINAAAEGLTIDGDNNIVDNVKVYCNENVANAATDYYITLTGNSNTVKNSLVNRAPGLTHLGHGFSIKSNAVQVIDQGLNVPVINPQNNYFTNNIAINVGEGFCVRHRGVRFNVFENNFAYGTHTGAPNSPSGEGNGINIRDGASDNVFRNTIMENTAAGIVFNDTIEDGDMGANPAGHPGNNNVIDNAQVSNSYVGINFNNYSIQSDAGANTLKNSRFYHTRYMYYMARHAVQMSYINNVYIGTNTLSPKPGGYFRGSTYASDVIPSQFIGCTFQDIEGGMPSGF